MAGGKISGGLQQSEGKVHSLPWPRLQRFKLWPDSYHSVGMPTARRTPGMRGDRQRADGNVPTAMCRRQSHPLTFSIGLSPKSTRRNTTRPAHPCRVSGGSWLCSRDARQYGCNARFKGKIRRCRTDASGGGGVWAHASVSAGGYPWYARRPADCYGRMPMRSAWVVRAAWRTGTGKWRAIPRVSRVGNLHCP